MVDEHMDDVGSSGSSEGEGDSEHSGSGDENQPIESPLPSEAPTPKSSMGSKFKGKKKASPKKVKQATGTPAAEEGGLKAQYKS